MLNIEEIGKNKRAEYNLELNDSKSKDFHKDVLGIIFSYLNLAMLGVSFQVCKKWSIVDNNFVLQKKALYNEIARGNNIWMKSFGNSVIKEEDREKDFKALPENIVEIFKKNCPIYSKKRLRDTHILVWMPKSIVIDEKEQNLTLKSFGQLLEKKHFPDSINGGYSYFDTEVEKQKGDKTIDKAQWVLMTKEVLSGSRKQSYSTQQTLVSDLAKKSKMNYEVPKILEATVCILAEYVSTGTRLYSDSPWTYTRCQEKLEGYSYQTCVGCFVLSGLFVNILNYTGSGTIGVAALRKF